MEYSKFIKVDFLSDLKNLNVPDLKEVLVIGGAGTIGSNYIKQLLKYKPKKIVVVDFNENGLTELTRDLRSSFLLDYGPDFITYPVSLLSKTFDKIFDSNNFEVVANFAAHKHVRSEKDIISVEALINNNINGMIKLLELCDKKPPKYFFSVSTDKATKPINIMGASKLIMEKLMLSRKDSYRITSARFANVAFSNGSLLHGFEFRFNKKQPITCPIDIKRYFVTPEQSGQICLLATFLGESGQVFFPKFNLLDDQTSFSEIAIEFIFQKGKNPYYCKNEEEAKNFNYEANPDKYPILLLESKTTGEKEIEEFFDDTDEINTEQYSSLGFINPNKSRFNFERLKDDLDNMFEMKNISKENVIELIKSYIPEFTHNEKNKNLDQSM